MFSKLALERYKKKKKKKSLTREQLRCEPNKYITELELDTKWTRYMNRTPYKCYDQPEAGIND